MQCTVGGGPKKLFFALIPQPTNFQNLSHERVYIWVRAAFFLQLNWFVFLIFICWQICQPTNTKHKAGQSARCEQRFSSRHLPSLPLLFSTAIIKVGTMVKKMPGNKLTNLLGRCTSYSSKLTPPSYTHKHARTDARKQNLKVSPTTSLLTNSQQ